MSKKIAVEEHVGKTFGRLTVVRETRPGRWLFLCDCGTEKEIRRDSVFSGNTTSCGCLLRQMTAARSTTHGHSKGGKLTREFKAWRAMKARCYSPSNNRFPAYGGRGITVCERWRHSFENFLADMGPCPPGLTLDRQDNSKGYSPENCRWATPSEQARNRRNSHMITLAGESMTVAEAAERHGLTYAELHKQLYKGTKPEIAIAKLVGRGGH